MSKAFYFVIVLFDTRTRHYSPRWPSDASSNVQTYKYRRSQAVQGENWQILGMNLKG